MSNPADTKYVALTVTVVVREKHAKYVSQAIKHRLPYIEWGKNIVRGFLTNRYPDVESRDATPEEAAKAVAHEKAWEQSNMPLDADFGILGLPRR